MTLSERLQQTLDTAIARRELPCGNVLVLKNGEEIAYAEGGADLLTGKPIARDTIFRLYSQTKPITAAAVALLVERGVLDLLEPVDKYLPGFARQTVIRADGTTVWADRQVTLMDLLGMTAGLSYPGDDPAGRYATRLFDANTQAILRGSGMSTVAFCNEIGKLPLAFQPGSEYRYSSCADVLGAVVELADGRLFSRFLREEFFEPLGMTDTGFCVTPRNQDRLVTCAQRAHMSTWAQMNLCVGRYEAEPVFASGGAGLVSTLDDYARFATMLLNGGTLDGRQYLTPQTVAWLTSPQVPDGMFWDWNNGYNYGKLMRVCVDPGKVPGLARKGEYGWDGWLGTYFANFPDIGVTLLINQNVTDTGTAPVTRRLRNVVLSDPLTAGV